MYLSLGSNQKFQTADYKDASAYDYLVEFGYLSGIFSSNEYLIVNRDQSFKISDSYPNSSYDSGFSCFNSDIEY
jgi:hypothetical protein